MSREATSDWLDNGGPATLLSYSAMPPAELGDDGRCRRAARFLSVLPAKPSRLHRRRCRACVEFGDYLFVHAGLRPGRALEDQDPDDLVWIREPFLSSNADFGSVVVHGHTPVDAPELRANRINIDTGAVLHRAADLPGPGGRRPALPPDCPAMTASVAPSGSRKSSTIPLLSGARTLARGEAARPGPSDSRKAVMSDWTTTPWPAFPVRLRRKDSEAATSKKRARVPHERTLFRLKPSPPSSRSS